jgi:hypothetical protein
MPLLPACVVTKLELHSALHNPHQDLIHGLSDLKTLKSVAHCRVRFLSLWHVGAWNLFQLVPNFVIVADWFWKESKWNVRQRLTEWRKGAIETSEHQFAKWNGLSIWPRQCIHKTTSMFSKFDEDGFVKYLTPQNRVNLDKLIAA